MQERPTIPSPSMTAGIAGAGADEKLEDIVDRLIRAWRYKKNTRGEQPTPRQEARLRKRIMRDLERRTSSPNVRMLLSALNRSHSLRALRENLGRETSLLAATNRLVNLGYIARPVGTIDDLIALTGPGKRKLAPLGAKRPAGQKKIGPRSRRAGFPETPDPKDVVVRAMRSLMESRPRDAIFSAREVRLASGLGKLAFDRAALELQGNRTVFLHQHDFPGSATEEERQGMVTDPKNGVFYVGMNLAGEK